MAPCQEHDDGSLDVGGDGDELALHRAFAAGRLEGQ